MVGHDSGCSPGVITQKPVCIQKEAEESEALRLKQQFEAIGAEMELVPLEKAVVRSAPAQGDDDDDAVDEKRRIL